MIRFMLHTPVNVRGWMSDYIKASLRKLEEEIGEKSNCLLRMIRNMTRIALRNGWRFN